MKGEDVDENGGHSGRERKHYPDSDQEEEARRCR